MIAVTSKIVYEFSGDYRKAVIWMVIKDGTVLYVWQAVGLPAAPNDHQPPMQQPYLRFIDAWRDAITSKGVCS